CQSLFLSYENYNFSSSPFLLPFKYSDINTFVYLLNSRNVSPAALPISGSRFGPKIISATTIISIKLGKPICANPNQIISLTLNFYYLLFSLFRFYEKSTVIF